ncbi:glycoside hydrolase family 2 TIM barrel-domain containing protein [Mucilaginibacter myungsuensis]|uniref:beta-galactosidase n=1 Tax=Mucilaginibacter myungsuensis TaxID=649104 RepID=A0A929PYT0_9SPHI|nr:glycoside hydrolase family 2 TIM barrel-domain containing protein [Mucilaginibacter myungsuensis]MBE9663652.1 glycoside hydrolase family 2 [Mucilaginibacter myungsuensis]MDN3599024.1 glycoside hydrolase family 2 TIM barrel-domain containing protein [Mucilaginibacter myungsuensis]
MKKLLLQVLACCIVFGASAQSTVIKYLSGTDKDHTVLWDFYCTAGRKSGEWTKIPVPSNWELQGFGAYNYGGDKDKASEQGQYKHQFKAGPWKGKRVFIVFEGSMTDTKVLINGQQAGPIHQGAFYRFKYDITDLVKPNANNLLEVFVDKMSANKGVNDAERNRSDFWVFGGIYRPVYLEITPDTYIDRMAINAKADGSFYVDVYHQNLKQGDVIEAQIQKLNGLPVGKPFSVAADPATDHATLTANITKPLLWSDEFPNLYKVAITVKNKLKVIHTTKQKFGFRTVEVRPGDGLYVNGARTVLKGTCRHSFWPETGRTLSYDLQVKDVKLMKEMNNNAVRMSHYPPDQEFLDVCDSLGLYVLDELTGWQSKYDTLVGRKLVKELVVRDVNHPSILFWDNGNEGGWNKALDNDYALYDPQKRNVLHPWETFGDVNTKHYPDYAGIMRTINAGKDIFMPTEFMHGLYDGGIGAGLEDFWREMYKYPHLAGGFLWAFVDESVIRTDKNNTYDGTGNRAPDGVLGPHREKEASFYTVKELWSPVYINTQPLTDAFDGKIEVENRYAFTKLSQCKFKWQLVKLPAAQGVAKKTLPITGIPTPLELAPGAKGMLDLKLPANWKNNDALYLTAYGPKGEELFTWSWAIKSPKEVVKPAIAIAKSAINISEVANELIVKCDGIRYYFSKASGYLVNVIKGNTDISLSGGPSLAGVETKLKDFTFEDEGDQYVVEAEYEGGAEFNVKWTFASGKLPKLEYSYAQTGDVDFMGITFNYPEAKVTGVKYLGRGPYRTWKNRVPGQQFGVWSKDYNNTITGETWGYPEFKGFHSEVNWATIENKEAPFTVYTDDKNMYLQLYQPAREKDPMANNSVEPPFPKGTIGFLNGISAIGTKFQAAKAMGPQSQKYHLTGETISGTLWFDFIH